MNTENVYVPGISEPRTVVLPETVEDAKNLGVDLDLAVSCGFLWLLHKEIANALMQQPGEVVANLVAAGVLVPTKAKSMMGRYLAMEPGERKEFEAMLIQHLNSVR